MTQIDAREQFYEHEHPGTSGRPCCHLTFPLRMRQASSAVEDMLIFWEHALDAKKVLKQSEEARQAQARAQRTRVGGARSLVK
eukprot:33852-Pleurochrysis_carterae.AAC.2